jgi:uncharacterized RDD family membrane protein YckC
MEIRYPELKTRIQSTFIDMVLMIGLMFLASTILEKINPSQEEDEDGWIRAAIFISIWCIYEPVSMVIGSTLGNYLMKIRVRKTGNTEKRINLLQAYIRFFLKVFLGWISFITIHFSEQRRAIHDLAAATVMIEK